MIGTVCEGMGGNPSNWENKNSWSDCELAVCELEAYLKSGYVVAQVNFTYVSEA